MTDVSAPRTTVVESRLDSFLREARPAPVQLAPDQFLPQSRLTARKAVELFEDMCLSRALDVAARELKRQDRSYYTISSAGHELNVVVGAQLRLSDPCFLHYRSGALMMARARRLPGSTPGFDTLLGICASREEPISGGRHKVWGSRELWVPPQTSTIASHLPKAVGMAFAISRAKHLHLDLPVSSDSVVCCSFGDASTNHATALAGINAARYAKMMGNPMRMLFLCEDNRRGISVETPKPWIGNLYSHSPYMRYFEAVGEIDEVWNVTQKAIETCRSEQIPVFLHLRTQRLWGHAGSDMESAYRTQEEIETTESKDCILRTARRLVATGAALPETLAAVVHDTRARVAAMAREASTRPKLDSAEEVRRPLFSHVRETCETAAARARVPDERRREVLGPLPEHSEAASRRTLAANINAALADGLLAYPEMLVFGEDVGKKGGVYGVTRGLQERFGRSRVFDTLLDETTILGVAQGAAQLGLLPIPEIQYLAYLHNAIDQLRGEACSLSFFSNGQFLNPMVVRIASFAYQKGFGGHFHNDNAIGALREIPGLAVCAPALPRDAGRMLLGALAMARQEGRVVAFLEPIALYHTRDLHAEKDGGWLGTYAGPTDLLLPGEVGVHHPDAQDLLIVTYANGTHLSLRAARTLAEQHGLNARVVDLRWLSPLPMEAVWEEAQSARAVLVVDECRATGAGVADAVVAGLAERGLSKPVRSVRGQDTYIPLGPAADLVLVQEDTIVRAARELCR